TIREVGEGVTDRHVGQRVVATNLWGSHAELEAVPAMLTWPVPEGADIKAVACVPVAFGTADDCLFEFGHLQAGETGLIQAGSAGRDPQPFDAGTLSMGNQSLTGVFLGAEIATARAQAMIGALVDDVAARRLHVEIDRTYPLAEAAAAHAYLESRQAVGRVVL